MAFSGRREVSDERAWEPKIGFCDSQSGLLVKAVILRDTAVNIFK